MTNYVLIAEATREVPYAGEHIAHLLREKKVQGKKKRDAVVAEEEAKKKAAELQKSGQTVQSENVVAGEDVLGTQDEDLIF